jgi:ADP-ribose pyrophosphatase YjhB (NUDIX family)
MKRIEIVGDNYSGNWTNSRTACRAIIVKDGKMLLSYGTKTDQWMIPGGGLEKGEDDSECCCREVAEETGLLVKPSECLLEIYEYYEDWEYISKYFICEVIGETTINLTEREKAVGMEPRWVATDFIKTIFSTYQSYAGIDEMRRGLYLREYSAICELEGKF